MSDRPAPTAPRGYPLRTPASEELRAFMAPLEEAFGERFSAEEWTDEVRAVEADRSVAAFDGETSVGFASACTFRMAIPGGEIPVGGLTAVGVLPSHRRRGILRSLIAWHFADCRGRGEPASILWASEGAIYQRFGYGPGAVSATFDLERTRAGFLQPVDGVGRVRFVDLETGLATIPAIYEPIRRVTPGGIGRTEDDWRLRILFDAEYRRVPDGPKSIVLYEEDGVALGYAIIRRKAEWDDRGPKSTLTVMEALGTTPRAERGLWSWLLDLDLTARIRAVRQPVPHPLQLVLAEPRRLGLTVADGIWLRLLDVPAALTARSYAAEGALVLELRDTACPWNAGRWRLVTAASGSDAFGGRLEPTDEPAELALDVADLAAPYLGAFRFGELARAGRVEELRTGAAMTADRLFATDRAPWCSTMF